MSKVLVIVGAGPKALAVAAKNQVLSELGFDVPQVHIIERNAVGANWTGENGFTNGKLVLGTSPEKDVGFPYRAQCWSDEHNKLINEKMGRFSWQSFLVAQGGFSDWVDRGRPHPEHKKWAHYLQWVAAQLDERTHFHAGSVTAIHLEKEEWVVTYLSPENRSESLTADGVMLTGPGRVPTPARFKNSRSMVTVETFWKLLSEKHDFRGQSVAIVGSGETAASVAMALATPEVALQKIDIICPAGMTFTRGESFKENQIYSDPNQGKWHQLSAQDKRNFISRTDRGVFSVQAAQVLSRAEHIEIIPGRVIDVFDEGSAKIRVEYDERSEVKSYDLVVFATGGDQLSFLREILHRDAHDKLLARAGLTALAEVHVEKLIGPDMALAGMKPFLHLPMLSGMVQGPGFANLSSLGSLADRVLTSYVKAASSAGVAASVSDLAGSKTG